MEKYRNNTIIFFGDSITDASKSFNPNHPYGSGYVNMVKTEIEVYYSDLNIKIYNEGIGGNETCHLLERFDEAITSKKPDLVFLYIGTNDVWHPYDNGSIPVNKDILERMTLIVNKIKDTGSKVVLLTPFIFPRGPRYDFFKELKQYMDSFYTAFINYLNRNNLEYIDLNAIMNQYSAVSNNRLTKDSVHPDIIGHGIIAQAIIDYLNK